MRRWRTTTALAGVAALVTALAGAGAPDSRPAKEPRFTVRTLTTGPKHHFFGYYGINPWNRSGRFLICLETDFQDHMPSPQEPASVGLVDAETGKFTKITETRAWNFQQGTMLHWDPRDPEHRILFNDRKDDEIVSVRLDVRSKQKRYLPRPISAVSHDGKYALSLTYGRLYRLRRVVGYPGARDPNPKVPAPEDDGIFLMDLTTGETRLIISIARVHQLLVKSHPELQGCHMWFNHTLFNTDDTRFLFLARARVGKFRARRTATFTANRDGSGLREAIPYSRHASHFDWRNATEILSTFRLTGYATKHVLFTDGRNDYNEIGKGFLFGDGHCTFGPDRNWFVTDPSISRPKGRQLQIFNVKTNVGFVLGRFPLGKYKSGDLRCDLHPRWKPTGDAICFDALETNTWTRQLHVVELNLPK